jgi:nickel transport protein
MRIVPFIVAAATLALQALPAQAHGIWFAQRADRLALVYGDGAEDLDAVKRLPKISAVGGLGADGRPVAVTLEPEGRMPFVNLAAKPAIVTATMNNGLWSKAADGQWHGKGKAAKPAIVTATMNNGLWSKAADGQWHGKGKDEVPGATISGRFMKYATHLVALPAGGTPPVAGMALQIVAAGAAFPRHKGEPLTVQVLFDGKPLAGAKVWQDVVTDPDAAPLVADRDGRVTLPVRNQGLNVVKAEHESAPVDAGKASMTHHFATLSFMLGHAPE